MDGEMLRENLKAIYKDAEAPEGFSSRVMSRIDSPSKGISFKLRRGLRPALAIAACFVLALGMYLAGSGLPGVTPSQDLQTAEVPFEEEPVPGVQIGQETPYVNGDVPVLIAEAEKDSLELPSVSIDPASGDVLLAENGQAEVAPDPQATAEAPVSNPPVGVRLVNAAEGNNDSDSAGPSFRKPEPIVTNGYSHTTAEKPVDIVPLTEQELAFVLSEKEIPHPSVFISRRRVIDSLSVNVSVGTINNALRKIDERERIFGISADTEATELRADGTIVVMRSYIVPTTLANAFIINVSTIGGSDVIKRDSADITEDYNRMLDMHRDLMTDLARTGQGVREINKIAEELLFLDERAKDGVKNVVVWLEDSVDF